MKSIAKTDTNSPRLAVAYLRVSTDEQELGLDAQRAAIEQCARKTNIQIVSWHVERGVSGACPLDKRTELLRCLDQLRDTHCQYLLIARRDRLARDVIAAATIERLVERAGASIQSAAGEGEGDTPESKLLRRMVDAFAEYERACAYGIKYSPADSETICSHCTDMFNVPWLKHLSSRSHRFYPPLPPLRRNVSRRVGSNVAGDPILSESTARCNRSRTVRNFSGKNNHS